MRKSPTWLVLIICALFSPARAKAQSLPLLNMGYSGAGIGSDLLKVIERAGLWRKHGIDVRTIYLSSGTLMAQTLSSGDVGVAGFDTPATAICEL
jgi:ABC-type nitrate/sulfonate/bicarbonate transport system substrate-binding protein